MQVTPQTGSSEKVTVHPGPWRVVLLTVLAPIVPPLESLIKANGHKLVGILTSPGPRSRRTETYKDVMQLARPGLDVIASNYPTRWADMITPWRPDLIITAGFNWKVPADVLAVPRLGAINLHDGLLPRYRGLNATAWALRNDEPEYGVSVHFMTAALDDGPVLSQRRIPITDDDDIDTLLPQQVVARAENFQEAFDRIAAGESGTPQVEENSYTTPGLFEDAWLHIDWTKPARDVHVQVRSWVGTRDQPRGALGEIDGVLTRISKTQLVDGDGYQPATPGTILARDANSLLIQCADRPLRILQWQPEPAG